MFNEEFLSKGKISFGVYPSALLDSNVLDAIDRRVRSGKRQDGLEDWLRFVTEHNWDVSALFYYLEHHAKSQMSDFVPNAIRRTESLLNIHAMDESHYIKTGEIVPNPEAVAFYTEQVGAKNLNEVAEQRVSSFITNYSRTALRAMIESTEIALIKMILIHKFEQPKSSPVAKYEEFVRFLQDDLNIVLARELHLSLHYFCDRAGKLLGIQSNTPYAKALSTIGSTAWDIYLLRFPEMLFSGCPDELCLAYVTTHEKRLQELARLFTVERIHGAADGILPRVAYDAGDLPKDVWRNATAQKRPVSSVGISKGSTLGVPAGLLEAMRRALASFCTSH